MRRSHKTRSPVRNVRYNIFVAPCRSSCLHLTYSFILYYPTSYTCKILFSVRVGYNYVNPDGEVISINFHETVVDIDIDLTANFILTGISVDRIAAKYDHSNVKLDYPVVAFFCDEYNNQVATTPYTQGSAMQVCVNVDDEATEEVYVEDIISFVVSQPEGPASSSVTLPTEHPTHSTSLKDCTFDGILYGKPNFPPRTLSNRSLPRGNINCV